MKTLGWLGPGAAVATAIRAVGGNEVAVIAVTVAAVIAIAIAALEREWFWLRALRQPGHDLQRIMKATRSTKEIEAFAALLESSRSSTLAARVASQKVTAGARTPANCAPFLEV